MKKEHPILTLCLHLEVSASGYYDWQRRRICPGARAVEDQALTQEIAQIHTRSRKTYGVPRVEKELRKKGRCHGRNRVARLMKQKGLYGRQKGRYRVQTTDSTMTSPSHLTVWPKPPRPPHPINFG
jgi:transposase InsO family protein